MVETPGEKRVEIPGQYRRADVGDVDLIALPDSWDAVRHALGESGTLFDFAATRPSAQALAGRGVAYAIPAPGSYTDERWVVRHYRRGGFVARFLQDRYLDSGVQRPIRELVASAKARARGVPTPEVVAAAVYPVGGWYRADIVTRFLPHSRDLADALFRQDDATERRRAMALAGELIRAVHEAGVVHNDLNLKNILLVGDDGAECAWLLDLDRAVVMRDAAARFERNLMLRRFARSLRKHERANRTRLEEGEREAFAEAYARATPAGASAPAGNGGHA